MEPIRPSAVVDTNVMMNIVTCVDIANLYNHGASPEDLESTFKRSRVREAVLLSMFFHLTQATTFCLSEAHRIVTRAVDRDVDDSFETHFTTIWAHYVKPRILSDWTTLGPAEDLHEPKGSKADDLLVAHAKEWGVPLVSFEGWTRSGIDPNNALRTKASNAGVRLLRPAELYGTEENLVTFRPRFRAGAQAYVNAAKYPEITRDTMEGIDAYYQHVLDGVTRGYNVALPVRM